MQAEIFKKQYVERLSAAKCMMEESNKASVLFIVQIPVVDNTDLLLPVTRESLSNVVCFVEIGDEQMLDFILNQAEGIIDRIILDTDLIRPNSQRIIDYVLSHSSIPVMQYSDLKMWGDSAVDFVYQNERVLKDKKILISGKSYLTTHIVQAFISKGIDVYLLPTDFLDVCFPIDTNSSVKITSPYIHTTFKEKKFDILIGSNIKKSSDCNLINQYSINRVYDIGLQNFSSDCVAQWHSAGTMVYRFDNRAAVSSVILNLMETEDLINNVMGKSKILNITLISGGIMGERGDIVVDNVNNPSSVLGIADGSGSFIHDVDYLERDKYNINIIQNLIDKK